MPNHKPPAGAGGAIVRRAHDRENPYVQISRTLAQDDTLSLEARGLMLYLLSKPPDWQIRMGDLERTARRGREAMQRIMRELETARYIVRECHHNARGHWHWESLVYETPQPLPAEPLPENPSTVQPPPVAPAPAPPVTVNPAIYRESNHESQIVQTTENTAAPLDKKPVEIPPHITLMLSEAAYARQGVVNWVRAGDLLRRLGPERFAAVLGMADGVDWAAYWASVERIGAVENGS